MTTITGPFGVLQISDQKIDRALARISSTGSITYADGVTPEDLIRYLVSLLQARALEAPDQVTNA